MLIAKIPTAIISEQKIATSQSVLRFIPVISDRY